MHCVGSELFKQHMTWRNWCVEQMRCTYTQHCPNLGGAGLQKERSNHPHSSTQVANYEAVELGCSTSNGFRAYLSGAPRSPSMKPRFGDWDCKWPTDRSTHSSDGSKGNSFPSTMLLHLIMTYVVFVYVLFGLSTCEKHQIISVLY